VLQCVAAKITILIKRSDRVVNKVGQEEKCAAVCCSMLQSVAVCCSVLQHVAVCCSVLQSVAVSCSVLQCVAVKIAFLINKSYRVAHEVWREEKRVAV